MLQIVINSIVDVVTKGVDRHVLTASRHQAMRLTSLYASPFVSRWLAVIGAF